MAEASRGTRAAWLGWLALCGLALGLAYGVGLGRALSGGTPDSWTRTANAAPIDLASITGPLPASPDAWSLSHFQALIGPQAATRIDATVRVPPMGSIIVGFGRNTHHAVGIKLSRRDGRVEAIQGGRPLPCEGSAAPLGDGAYTVSVEATGGALVLTTDGHTLRCSAQSRGDLPLVHAGLHRVHLVSLETGDTALPPPVPGWVPWAAALFGGMLLGVLGVIERRLGARPALVALTSAPALVALPLLPMDGPAVLQAAHVHMAVGDWFALAVGAIGVAFAKVMHHAARLARRPPPWLGAGVALPAVAAVVTSLALGGRSVRAVLGYLIAGLAAGGIAWANANAARVRHFNLISLALVAVGVFAVEQALRGTDTGGSWSATGTVKSGDSWQKTAMNDFDALLAGEHTDYPDQGYPVAFQAKAAPIRLVALGSSSTGGAYQNDDLNEFYPARLDTMLGAEVEVVNQGVGGWTSLHTRIYFEDKVQALDADIVTVYLGHNDQLTESPVPYSELYRRWQGASAVSQGVGRVLGSSLLYQGLRRIVVAAGGSGADRVAVPYGDAVDNLDAIAATAAASGARTLLIGEAIYPDPSKIQPFYDAMQDVAADRSDTAWLSGADALAPLGQDAFLDDCHLTNSGHMALAKAVADELRRLGWVTGG